MRRTETHVAERRDGVSRGKSNHHVLAVGGADEVDAAVHRRWQQRFIELARANRIRRRLDTAPRLQLREEMRPSLGGDHAVRNEFTLLAQAYARAALRYAFEMQGARLRLHRLGDERAQKRRRLVVRYGRLRRLARRRRAFLLVRNVSLRWCGVRSRRGSGISALIGRRRGAVRVFQADHRHIAMTCVLGGLLRKVFADAVTRDGVIGDEEMGVLFLFLFWFFLFVVLVVAVVFGVAVVGVL